MERQRVGRGENDVVKCYMKVNSDFFYSTV